MRNQAPTSMLAFSIFSLLLSVHSAAALSSLYTDALQRAAKILSRESSHSEPNQSIEILTNISMFSRQEYSVERLLYQLESASVNEQCYRDLRTLGAALIRLEGWALQFIDAFGRPQPGLLQGATTWLGSFDQCLSTNAKFQTGNKTEAESFSGSYCLLQLQSRTAESKVTTTIVTMGTCWPDSCSMSDALNATSSLLSMATRSSDTLVVAPASNGCRSKADAAREQLSLGAIAMLAILGVIALSLLLGTGIDMLQQSRSRSSVAAAASVPVQASSSSYPASASATVSGGSSYDVDGNLDSSQTAGDEEALIATTVIYSDNKIAGRYRCLGVLKSVLLCFSVRTNSAKLLDQQQTGGGSLRCVNGIRFISMSWVILGHTYLISVLNASNLGQLVPQWLNDWTFQAVLNATVAVDTFFVLSGLLATYLFLREVDRRQGNLKRINWLRFYLHRYWRLTAPYMLILGAYTTLTQYLYDGPRYPRDGFDKNCLTVWWQNLLYINNFFSMADMCMPWTWYLANDIQFYFISPLILITMAKRPALGAGIASLGILASSVGLGVYSTLAGLGVAGLGVDANKFDAIYIRPWFRIGPYLVGSLAGQLAHRFLSPSSAATGSEHRGRLNRLRLHWSLRLLGWATAAALCLSVLYGLFDVERGQVKLSQPVTSLYNATFRLAWSIGIAWVVLACATGNGGPVAEFLSAGTFAPLSRLSYCAYLLHPIIMVAVETARRDTFQWNSWTPVGNFFAYLVASYAAAFGASLAFESPLLALERLTVE